MAFIGDLITGGPQSNFKANSGVGGTIDLAQDAASLDQGTQMMLKQNPALANDPKVKAALQASADQRAQSQVGNRVNSALDQQQAFAQAAGAQNGLANQSSVFNQLQGVASGTGPNPAQAQLANATGQNIQSQAALMAGQRGASQNAGLIARQAGMQGGNLQQQAVGQGAALQAQQSLNAMGQLGGIAGQQVAQQQNALNAYTQGAQNTYGQNLQAISGANTTNAGTENANAASRASITGGLLGGIGSAATLLKKAHGGEITAYAEGGPVTQPAPTTGPQSHAARFMLGLHAPQLAHGGQVNAMVSPGEVYLPPQQAQEVAKGKAHPLKDGKKIPGKAKVKGDSYANDTVPAKLEEGGVVIPRSIVEGKNAAQDSAAFVQAVLNQSAKRRK